MAIDSLESYKQYFQDMNGTIAGISDYRYGNATRVINAMRSEITYPCLWLETPYILPAPDDEAENLAVQYDGHFVVFSNAPIDDWALQDQTEISTLDTCNLILAKMILDSGNNEFDLLRYELEPISVWMADDLIGWRCSFSISFNGAACWGGIND